MNKLPLPILFLIVAALACNWGDPSRARKPTAPVQNKADQPQVTENSVFVPNLEAGSSAEATQSVLLPNVTGGESSPAEISPTEPALPADSTPPDPHVEMVVSPESIRVGESITITGTPVDLGLPYYYLVVRDEGVQAAEPMAQVTYDNVATALAGTSGVVAYGSATGSMDRVVFVLTGIAPGVTTITISVTGEVHRADGTLWQATGSGDILVIVVP